MYLPDLKALVVKLVLHTGSEGVHVEFLALMFAYLWDGDFLPRPDSPIRLLFFRCWHAGNIGGFLLLRGERSRRCWHGCKCCSDLWRERWIGSLEFNTGAALVNPVL